MLEETLEIIQFSFWVLQKKSAVDWISVPHTQIYMLNYGLYGDD